MMKMEYKGKFNKIFQGILSDVFRKEYPSLGAKEFCNKYNLDLNLHSLRCYARKNNILVDREDLQKRIKESKNKLDKNITAKKISLVNKKYNYDSLKEVLLKDFLIYKSARKLSQLHKLNEYAIKVHLKKWGCRLVHNPRFSEFTEEDIQFIINNKDILTSKEMSKEINKTLKQVNTKINKLNIDRDWKQLQKNKTRLFNLTNNPSKRPEIREKNSIRMRKLLLEHPEKGIMHQLRRNKITSLEKRMTLVLDKNNIEYVYNKVVRLGDRFKFPDFNISNKLIIECDGNYAHQSITKDIIRDDLFINNGYTILHFTEDQINKEIKEVEICILKKLKELNIQDGRKLEI